MDRVARYKELVKEVVREILAEMATFTPEAGVRTEVSMDDAAGHYQITQFGWSGRNRIHGMILHCDVRDGKIYLEHDGTSFEVVDMLIARGVPPGDMVLGWQPPNLRHLTPFAVA